MSRQIKLQTRELGALHVMLVRSEHDVWETYWAPLREHPLCRWLPRIPRETLDHALHGWTYPLVQVLGYEPKMILHGIARQEASECGARKGCPLYRAKDCIPTARNMPHCFVVGGLSGDLGHEVLRLWRDSVYVVVVEE